MNIKSYRRMLYVASMGILLAACDSPYYTRPVSESGPTYQSYDSGRYSPSREQAGERYSYNSRYSNRMGTVESVERINTDQARHLGAGAVIGALIGGVVGNQIGHGSGRTLATVGGAVAGGVVGDQVQNRERQNREGYLIRVRLDNGSRLTVAQDASIFLRVGERVRIEGEGQNLRVIPD